MPPTTTTTTSATTVGTAASPAIMASPASSSSSAAALSASGSCRNATAPHGLGAVGVAGPDGSPGCGSGSTSGAPPEQVGAHTPNGAPSNGASSAHDGRTEAVSDDDQEEAPANEVVTAVAAIVPATTASATAVNRKLVLCRRFKDSGGVLRNFNSLPLFVYATSSSTRATSADGVGVGREAAALLGSENDSYDLALCTTTTTNGSGVGGSVVIGSGMKCLPLSGTSSGIGIGGGLHHHHHRASMTTTSLVPGGAHTSSAVINGGGVAVAYQPHQLQLSHHHHQLLGGHHTPYTNNYHLHHSASHQHIHTEQTKSLQELQNEVGALLEFRDLVIETFPDLKHKMASMSSSSSAAAMAAVGGGATSTSVSGATTLTGSSATVSNSSMASRREWEPGIRMKRKVLQKEPSTSAEANSGAAATPAATTTAEQLSSSSLSRSRSNSHSGKKEPKSGENNNGSVVQDSGFSTETSSSKDGHSASSTNGAMTGASASNRLACPESDDDELMNLLDVIHRKSSRLRDEVEHLQKFERQNLRGDVADASSRRADDGAVALSKSASTGSSSTTMATTVLTPATFREKLERLNKEDIKQLRKERDRLLDKLAEMEAETLTGRIKAAKMNDQVEELISVKKDLEEQLKLAMAQKLELSSRVQQLQQQQQMQQHSKSSSSSQSDYSSQRLNFLSSATTVLSTGSGAQPLDSSPTVPSSSSASRGAMQQQQQQQQQVANTFQPVVVEQDATMTPEATRNYLAFHQSASSDSRQQQQLQQPPLGRLDGIVSTPGGRNSKCRVADSKRFQAILLETNVIELQRHLLTLTVQNQVLMQKLDQSSKSKSHLVKRLDKSKDDVEDLRFQLEEKNIELEGTKAQLRVLESRMHSSTPSTGTSYTHSQHDYETNRSSASTTLMMSRRGGGGSGIDSHMIVDSRSVTPISGSMLPPPTSTQISTPSMKAMIHLPMDEVQQHSSSTESAHDLQHELPQMANKLMSTSVGGTSPFAQQSARQQQQQQQSARKLGATASKPSKIPLPGSKAAAYFAGKPPSGRVSTAGRSPPSANISTSSNASSKSSLSRSTGNLHYGKSPNSLKRADSAQSIRKDASSSLSTNTSRSSTSSIPMATTPHSAKAYATAQTPSPRVLQNSPLPKLKRDSLTSRVRHLDSLSRVYQHNSNDSNLSSGGSHNVTVTSPSPNHSHNNSGGSYMVASTPKTTTAAQMGATMRKDLQLSSSSFSHGSQQFLRRATGGAPTTAATTARRFSSASVVGARIAGRMHGHDTTSSGSSHSTSSTSSASNTTTTTASEQHNANSADTDSGKKLEFLNYKNIYFANLIETRGNSEAFDTQWGGNRMEPQYNNNNQMAIMHKHQLNELIEYPEQQHELSYDYNNDYVYNYNNWHNKHTYDSDLINESWLEKDDEEEEVEEKDMEKHCSFHSYDEEEAGSDNLLVTFDYGFSDSIHQPTSTTSFNQNLGDSDYVEGLEEVTEEEDEEEEKVGDDDCDNEVEDINGRVWFCSPQAKDDAAQFQVHRMRHDHVKDIDNDMSFGSSLIEYDVDEEISRDVPDVWNRKPLSFGYHDYLGEEEDDEATADDDDEENGEEFFDSLECA